MNEENLKIVFKTFDKFKHIKKFKFSLNKLFLFFNY